MAEFNVVHGNSPVLGAAIHDGHNIRKDLYPFLNLKEHERMREEDPYTGYLTEIFDTRIIVNTSRFEVDLNRPREKAVYRNPEDAWGLNVWNSELPEEVIERSLAMYDQFYSRVDSLLKICLERFGYFIVLDLHSYNHRRTDSRQEAPSQSNPEINIGTASIHPSWQPVARNLIAGLSNCSINGHEPDVRENVKFKGGEFCRWINTRFTTSGCALAIEFKKTFMDEWTGRVNIHHLQDIQNALASVLPELKRQFKSNLIFR